MNNIILVAIVLLFGVYVYRTQTTQDRSNQMTQQEEVRAYNDNVRANYPPRVSKDGGKTWQDACEYYKNNPDAGGAGGMAYRSEDGSTLYVPECGESYTVTKEGKVITEKL